MLKSAFFPGSAAFLRLKELAVSFLAAFVVKVSFLSSESCFALVFLLSARLKLPLGNELGAVRITGFMADLATRVALDECSTL